jgi:HPt (histidine-containing phosphotransfer) domain-containing protein
MEYTKDDLIDFTAIQNLIDLGGDDGKGFLKEIVELYLEQYPELFNSIKSNAESNNNVEMYQAAHALKGASLNIGVKEISSLCKQIELKGKENDMKDIPELIKTLEIIFPLTLSELKKLY